MPRKKSKAKGRVPPPAPTAKDTPPYTFLFRPANGLRKKTIEKAKDLLPEDLCGILMDKQPNPPQPRRWHDSWWSMTMSSSWPQSSVSSDPSGEHVYDEQRNEMEYEVKEQFRGQEHQVGAEAKGRHHRELYVMQTNAEVDKSVEQVLSSAKVTKVFRQVNSIVGQEKKRRALVASICRLSTSVRSQLGAAESGYGKFVRCKSLPIVDLRYPPMDVVNLDGHIMVQAAEVAGQPEWSNMVSFIVVKKTDAEDLNNKAVRQGLFYVRQMHQYRPITSHVHFATWCGHFVRLWYANATIYGCSRAFDTRTPNDRKDIVRILLFFSLKGHSGQLSGYWNLAGQHSLKIEADVATDSTLVKARVTEHRVRPGPFGSRTAVFVEQDKTIEQDAGKRTLLVKVSWLYEHLRLHELTMLRGIQSLGLPYAPRPIGLAVIPTAGFQRTTSETMSSSATQVELYEYTREYDSKSATRHRTVSALVTEQCLGDYIGMQVSMHDLMQIHVQVAEQLLRLAKGGYHYRDFNPGNVRLLRGTRNTLLFIDFGNMRTNLSPLQQSGMQMCDAEALAARAADDGQSANPIYLSTCCARALKDAWIWTLTLRHTSEDIYFDLRAGLGGTNVFGCRNKEPKQILRRIIDSLRKVFVKSHRYIDDLEGAVYLQFWQVAQRWERTEKARKELEKEMRKDKGRLWESTMWWEDIMDKMQGRRTKGDWPELMYALRKTILSAREKLSKTLERQYDRKVSLAAFEEAYAAWENKLTAEQLLEIKDAKDHYEAARVDKLQLKHFFLAFFDGKGLLDNNRIHKIERKCFKACIKLLKEAAERMKEKEEQSMRRAARKSENLEGAAEVSAEEGEDEDESSAERSQSGTDEHE